MGRQRYAVYDAGARRYLRLARRIAGAPDCLHTTWTGVPAIAYRFQSVRAARRVAEALYIDYIIMDLEGGKTHEPHRVPNAH